MNSHVSLKSFHMFSTLHPEINMLSEFLNILESWKHVRNHFNFQN